MGPHIAYRASCSSRCSLMLWYSLSILNSLKHCVVRLPPLVLPGTSENDSWFVNAGVSKGMYINFP